MGTGRRNGPAFRSPAPLHAAEALCRVDERGAFRPPGCSALTAEYRVSHASELALGANMPRERLVSSRVQECRQVAGRGARG